MGVVLCVVLALIALSAGYRFVRGRRRHRRAASDSLRRVFRPRELRQLNRHLERIAVDELRRLEVRAVRYVAGDVGYVVVVSGSRHGIGLGLSDGHRLELGGVSRSTLKLLEKGATEEELRPARVRRYGFFSYGLLLRGKAGAEMEIFADRVTLAL
ncbi:MAG: hypothetical protein JWR70_1240 [Modestobacter sp.]|jgi:hypothetical protein|nr:hypothetical protein [Modestobacter sp.]